ncbi:two-component system phosphate regulon sensor histidine kinase PhoR [Aestuariispira insulae]|uniref:histidine kinase n=2 Tax=Aestuariispira insulae TaxID=1461337 RepID=A0A3D9HEQ2_9PROT|nr:two-component system phosphate regulon sensor histidine kinase PhoR [Aestuariispira insulae]
MPVRAVKWTLGVTVPLIGLLLLLLAAKQITIWVAVSLACVALGSFYFVLKNRLRTEAVLEREVTRLRSRIAVLSDDDLQRSKIIDEMIDTLPDPLIFLDADQKINRVNRAARALGEGAKVGNQLSRLFRQPDFMRAVNKALAESVTQEADLVLSSPVAQTFKVRMLPINEPRSMQQSRNRSALLMVMQDVTQAHRMEQLRADFVANVSHELRTPLTSLMGFIETLRGPAKDDARAHERFLGIMQEQSSRMLSIIEDLLSLSRIELDEHARPSEEVYIGEVLRKVEDVLTLKADNRDMPIVIDVPDQVPPIMGDSNQLIQVFQNLVDNALKYGKPGTSVEVIVRREEAKLKVDVRDHGAGIPREHLPRLTERFYRVDTARSREMGGTGLGLAIVKHIVKRHRGRITVESEVGQGTTFTVTLPIS